MSKKVVVTGGAGFIGSNLVDALLERGFEVHIIDNLSGGKKENINPKAIMHLADITDLKIIKPIFKDAEYVFHLAALPRVQYSIEHPDETNLVNVEGTLNVLMAAAEAKVKKLIYSASSSAYGDQIKMPLTEDLPAMPKSPYGLQKYVGELYCRLWSEIYELPTVCLRYFNVYGPRNNPDGAYALVIAKFIQQRQNDQALTITGDGEQTRDFTHVRDVVRANILAAENDKVGGGEVINIGSSHNYSVNKIAEFIGGPSVHIPARLEPRDTLADNSLARKLLGWQPQEEMSAGIAELKKIAGLK
jgi:Nucleoside-diphosphate-sugar epimerases